MAEEINYIELNVDNMSGILPITKSWRVIYYMRRTSNMSAKMHYNLTTKKYIDGPLPTGYVVAAIRAVNKTATEYNARTSEESRTNANEAVILPEFVISNWTLMNEPRAYCVTAIEASASAPAYVEITIEYAIVPAGCIPAA